MLLQLVLPWHCCSCSCQVVQVSFQTPTLALKHPFCWDVYSYFCQTAALAESSQGTNSWSLYSRGGNFFGDPGTAEGKRQLIWASCTIILPWPAEVLNPSKMQNLIFLMCKNFPLVFSLNSYCTDLNPFILAQTLSFSFNHPYISFIFIHLAYL